MINIYSILISLLLIKITVAYFEQSKICKSGIALYHMTTKKQKKQSWTIIAASNHGVERCPNYPASHIKIA